ncbi:MAG: ComEA family DNA-binding protein [Candidatus Neomarinimicrobiota bacterium]
MKVFTAGEKRVLLFLSALLFIGLVVQQVRRHFERPTTAEQAARERSLEAFREGSLRYVATADSAAAALWALGLESPIDVNRASWEELQILPGIGPVLAQKIVDYRARNGYFRTVQDLIEVKGIGPKLLMRWEGFITIQPDTMIKKGMPVE